VSPFINTRAYLQILHSVVVAINSLTSQTSHFDVAPSNVFVPLALDANPIDPQFTPASSVTAADKRDRGGFFSAANVGDRLRLFLSQAKVTENGSCA